MTNLLQGSKKDKSYCLVFGGVLASCFKLGTRQQILLTPIPGILFHPIGTFGMSLTPPRKGQGFLRGDSAAL